MFKSRFNLVTNVSYDDLLRYYDNQVVIVPRHNHEEIFTWCRDSGSILVTFLGTWAGDKDVWWIRKEEDIVLFKLAWA